LRPAIGSSDQSDDRLGYLLRIDGYLLRIDGVFNYVISIFQLPKDNCRIVLFVSPIRFFFAFSTFFWSFEVQYEDHFWSRIICSPIWGSFVDPYRIQQAYPAINTRNSIFKTHVDEHLLY